MNKSTIQGFSKLSKEEKIDWVIKLLLNGSEEDKNLLKKYWNSDKYIQNLHEEFSENTLTNFYLPFGVAPNFLIDEKHYTLPLVIEESSVVAAACAAAKFWLMRGGFKTEVVGVEKVGHVHFLYLGDEKRLNDFFTNQLKNKLIENSQDITKGMRHRGGGILSIALVKKTDKLAGYYQIEAHFDTKNAMGANFINSCLENFAQTLKTEIENSGVFSQEEKKIEIIMSILSNYTPNCLVRAWAKCPISSIDKDQKKALDFVHKFQTAVAIAEIEPYRAVTHNKGIMNGIDAFIIATGNDFRAIEAAAHAYASKNGKYKSLTYCNIEDDCFIHGIEIPMALGSVGGLTNLHPLVKIALKMLGNPDAKLLMRLAAVAGLAQNFAALRALVTSGIQKGHMKMHLFNILNSLGIAQEQRAYFVDYFKDKIVSHHTVSLTLKALDKKN